MTSSCSLPAGQGRSPSLCSPNAIHHHMRWNPQTDPATEAGADEQAQMIKQCFHDLDKEIKDGSGKPPVYQSSNQSVEKTSTVTHMAPIGTLLLESPGAPSRQGSFGGELGGLLRTKTSSESQNIFHEVLDQLTSQEESLPRQTSLYTLPSMNFLESLLDEMDSRNASQGLAPPEPPMYLPVDSFDLPGLDLPAHAVGTLEDLGLESPQVPAKMAYSCPGMQPCHSNDTMNLKGISTNVSMLPTSPFLGHTFLAPTAGSAAPSPQKGAPAQGAPPRVISDRYIEEDDDELLDYIETSIQTSKSGRCRKVSSFVSGQKRKSHMISQYSAPAEYGQRKGISVATNSNMTHAIGEAEVASGQTKKVAKSRKGKPTVCLNCGSMETPQWRCGPLGPRTLCNACGVRYKKGLPLSCWPLRNGLILPPGAELPPNIVIPEGMTIVTQPALH